MSAFLREAAWRLYLLYFRPGELERQLRTGLQGQGETASPVRLIGVLGKLNQETARRYLAQVALWCGVAAAPLLLLAPFTAHPPAISVLLLSFAIVWLTGLGAAVWDAPLGPGAALFFALLLGCAPEPGSWRTVVANTDNLAAIRQALWPDLPVSLGIGLAVGFWGVRWHLWSKRAAGVLAGVLAGVVASIVAGVGEVSVAVVVAFGMAVVVTDEELDATSVAVIMAFIVAFGVAFGVAGDVAGVVAVGVAFVVAGVVAVGVAGSVAVGVAFVVAGVVAVAMAGVVAGVVASVVAGVVGNLSLLPWSVLAATALTLGMTAAARRPSGRALALLALLMPVVPVVLLWETPLQVIVWSLAGLVGLTRLPLLLAYMAYTVASDWRTRQAPARVWRFLQRPPWQWDELIPLPLPRLDRLLVLAAQQDRARGLAAIAGAANTWRQGQAAQSALLQLVSLELGNRKSERAIAAAARNLSWLPEILPQTVKDTAGRFRAISRLVEDKLNITDADAQMAQLSRAVGELDNLIQGLTFVPQPERERFLPVAQAWRAVLQAATVRLPNPYVAGDPLRGGQGGLFVGREDVLRQLQSHLQDRSQRPTLVLFGQRRMGKSSLLYQLPQQFDANTIPVRVDCQAGEMQESNAAFLYNLARAIQQQARALRQIDFPDPPSLAEMTFTTFNGWIQQIEQQLGERVLLLSLDEFESVGAAVAGGWLDERIFGFLRNLIQHHPPITLLLAGSHRPSEIGRPWSDYLISAVVLPISYLDPEETARLITQPIPGFPLRYTAQAVQRIIALTRCQPLLVQLLCQQIVLLLNERGERAADVEEVEAAVPGALSQGGSLYFTYLRAYDAGSEGEAMLQALADKGAGAILPEQALTRDDPARGQALQRLLARDIVERVDGGIRFEVELTRRWWAEYRRGEV